MKILRWLVILMVLGLSSSAVLADGIDPAIGVRGCCDQSLWPGTVQFTLTTADFTSPGFFINEGTITNFLVSFDVEQGPFTPSEGTAFPTVQTIVPGFEALLSGGTIFPAGECIEGCTSNEIFGNFAFDLEGVTIGPNGTTVTISSVPEPASIILMLSGLGAVGLRRLRRNKVPS